MGGSRSAMATGLGLAMGSTRISPFSTGGTGTSIGTMSRLTGNSFSSGGVAFSGGGMEFGSAELEDGISAGFVGEGAELRDG